MLDADLDEEEVTTVSIAAWIVDEIEEDQIEFATPIFSKMYNMLADEVEKEHVPNTDWWCAGKIRDHQGGYRSVDGEVYAGELEVKGDLPS